ncbi:MAG: hypothetical protein P4K94_01010 [Terracidiphilus sp.]|nr:hypothetical protein [Terracidiphilus sp.]
MTAFCSPVVVIWAVIAAIHYWNVLVAPHPENSEFTLQLIAIGIYIAGSCFFAGWLSWILTGETILTLSPDEMKVRHRVLGIGLDTYRFSPSDIHNLRYIPPVDSWPFKTYTDPSTSSVRFRVGHKSYSLAKGITETEAFALMLEMHKVCQFTDGFALDRLEVLNSRYR